RCAGGAAAGPGDSGAGRARSAGREDAARAPAGAADHDHDDDYDHHADHGWSNGDLADYARHGHRHRRHDYAVRSWTMTSITSTLLRLLVIPTFYEILD